MSYGSNLHKIPDNLILVAGVYGFFMVIPSCLPVGIAGPDERFGFAVVLAEIAIDRCLQIDERVEDAALQSPAGQGGEKAFTALAQEHEVGVK